MHEHAVGQSTSLGCAACSSGQPHCTVGSANSDQLWTSTLVVLPISTYLLQADACHSGLQLDVLVHQRSFHGRCLQECKACCCQAVLHLGCDMCRMRSHVRPILSNTGPVCVCQQVLWSQAHCSDAQIAAMHVPDLQNMVSTTYGV